MEEMKKEVMITAWEIARTAVVKYGGKVVEYLSESLKMAWAKIKGGAKMKGSEKQVAWAENIKAEVIRHIDKFNDLSNSLPSKEDKDYYTKANALTAEEAVLFGNDHKQNVREVKSGYKLSREERALETKEEKKARREAQAQAIADYEQSLIQDILKQDDASYWIDNFKFLV